MIGFVWSGSLRVAHEIVQILDGFVTGGSLDNARSAVLEAKTRGLVVEALDEAEEFSLALTS
jgi:hypothetical protein